MVVTELSKIPLLCDNLPNSFPLLFAQRFHVFKYKFNPCPNVKELSKRFSKMGNCSLKGAVREYNNSIRVLTDAGEIIDFKGPKLAKEITNDFPGYGICKRGHASISLAEDESLVNGGFYYLLLMVKFKKNSDSVSEVASQIVKKKVELDCDQVEPPKMSSAEFVANLSSESSAAATLEVLSSKKNGVWKVKLVISSQQLGDILSQHVNTEALIEKMRTAAVTTPRRNKRFWVAAWKKAAVSRNETKEK